MILHQRPMRHAETKVKVVFLSGLSNPATCALTAAQRHFLANLSVPEAWKVYRNFPYVEDSTVEASAPPLWRASLRNVRQFLTASNKTYRAAAQRHWRALAESADVIAVFALSCGLEIMNNCIEADPLASRVRVFAFGPVARSAPRMPATLVQGTRDFISRFFFRKFDHEILGVGHMDYLQHPSVRKLSNLWLCTSTSP